MYRQQGLFFSPASRYPTLYCAERGVPQEAELTLYAALNFIEHYLVVLQGGGRILYGGTLPQMFERPPLG